MLLHSIYAENCYRVLNDKEFVTYMKKVEAILNRQPLTALSDDPNDFSFLSPMLILNTCLEPSLPLREFVKKHGLRKSWKTAQKMADHFWRNWRLFYLPTLQKRNKWMSVSTNISVGDLVLLKEANAPRNQWP